MKCENKLYFSRPGSADRENRTPPAKGKEVMIQGVGGGGCGRLIIGEIRRAHFELLTSCSLSD